MAGAVYVVMALYYTILPPASITDAASDSTDNFFKETAAQETLTAQGIRGI